MRSAALADTPTHTAAFTAAREICRRHAKSFYFASAFLPKAKRQAAFAVYAFCRMIDDAIDNPDEGAPIPPELPATVGGSCCSSNGLDQRLTLFRDRLDDMYDHRLDVPNVEMAGEDQLALYAFSLTVHRYQIPKPYFLALAEGCRMDLTVSRYATWARLENYCYHVAGVVGLIMSCVFGVTNSDAARQAVKMGNAMQLTNILRDVKEDWERGRIYLPLEDMARYRYSERDLAAGRVNDNFRALMKFEIARARQLYRDGAEGLCWLAGDGSRLTASSMAVIYGGILDAIERQNYDVFCARARLTTAQKFRRLPAAWRLSRRPADARLPEVFGKKRSAECGMQNAERNA